jgi:hypothetical protein
VRIRRGRTGAAGKANSREGEKVVEAPRVPRYDSSSSRIVEEISNFNREWKERWDYLFPRVATES